MTTAAERVLAREIVKLDARDATCDEDLDNEHAWPDHRVVRVALQVLAQASSEMQSA